MTVILKKHKLKCADAEYVMKFNKEMNISNKQVHFIYLISTRTASKQKLINLSVIQNRHDRSMTCSVYECVPIQIRIRSPDQAASQKTTSIKNVSFGNLEGSGTD